MALAAPAATHTNPTIAIPGLARALVSTGKLPLAKAEEIFRQATASQTSFVSELIQTGAVSAPDLAHAVSTTFALPLLDLDTVDPILLPKNLLEVKTAVRYRVQPLAKKGNRLIVATADPSDVAVVEKIKFATQSGIDWIVVEHDKLTKLLEAMTKTATESLDNIVGDDFEFNESTLGDSVINEEDNTSAVNSEVDDAPVVKFLQKMLIDAFSMRASDLHFEPYEHTYRVRFRVDGELREITSPPIAIKEKLASRIKVISKLDISEKRVPQDGRMKLKIGADRVIDFRVSTLPTLFGEKIVIRILDSSSAKLGIEALGYEPIEKDRLVNAIGR
ncbi:MAG: type pilus assembly ATPase PilB, partial [Pseudomonadota bacterium]